jgi:hypothetical protein
MKQDGKKENESEVAEERCHEIGEVSIMAGGITINPAKSILTYDHGLVTFRCTNRFVTLLPAGRVTLICCVVPLSLRTVGALIPTVLQSLSKVSLHSTM